MWSFISDTISGGWNAVQNVIQGVGQGVSTYLPGFFPQSQRVEPIRTQIQQAAPSAGIARATMPEAPSIRETAEWAYNNWMNSPFEYQFSEPVPEPTNLLSPWTQAIDKVWKSATGSFVAINEQLPEYLMRKWGIIETPEPQNTQGDVVYHVHDRPSTAPDTQQTGAQGQPPGSFNLGFPQPYPIPVAGANTTAGRSTAYLGIAAGLVILYLLLKKG